MRNNVCLAYFILNALWIAIIFMIQLREDELSVLFIEYGINGRAITIEPLGKQITNQSWFIYVSVIVQMYKIDNVGDATLIWHKKSLLLLLLANNENARLVQSTNLHKLYSESFVMN